MRTCYRNGIVLTLWCLLQVLWCRADAVRLYTSDRLSSGLVTSICQDRYGFIWIGTEYGLNKFDGYRFYSYTYSRTDSTTITDNEVSALFVDRDGQLWVGCSKGLSRYDYAHDSFQRCHFPNRLQPRISSMLQDTAGRLLVGTAGYGLYTVSRHASPVAQELPSPDTRYYSRMHLDREGHLWCSSHLPTLTKFTIRDGRPAVLRNYSIGPQHPRRFIEYNDRQLLIVCMHSILSYNYQTGEVSDAGIDLSLLPPGVSIEDATLSHDGHLYLATTSGVFDVAEGLLPSAHSQWPYAHVVDVLEDRDHNLWVTCYNKGVMLLSHEQTAFSTWSLSGQHYMTGGGVTSITTADDGQTWCAVQNSGVYRLDTLGHVTAHPQSPTGTRILYRDRHGHYWLTTDNTLYRYQPDTGRAQAELTLSGRGLNCLCDDPQGRLYIGVFGSGLYVYDPATRRGELLSMQQTDRQGGYLCNDWIKSLCLDSRGLLWICTTNGLSVMQPDGYVFNSLGRNMLLEGQQCFAACETADGDMLIGTGSGLYRYDWQRRETVEVPGTDALHDKMICAMVCDRQGTIWISTTAGIWQYDGHLVGHVAGNGLTTREYMLGALLHRPDDRITFGTADGLVTFSPTALHANSRQPATNYHAPTLTRFTLSANRQQPIADRFTLDYADNSFTLEFSLFDYLNADNITYQYRLNGSQTWMQTDEGSNLLTFNHLQPGHYQIEVRALGVGRRVSEVTTLRVTIRQPWYQSTWAYVFYALLIASFGGLVAFSWNRYQAEKRLHLTINDLRSNMRWLREKFFGSLEEKGDIKQVKVKGNNDALMERVVRCVNDNLSNPDFSVEMLTSEVGISRAQLHRKMKEMTGLSTSEFIRNLRLEQASRLIREGKINITQVAYSVGFNNQAHFSTVFKKHFGMTPTEYADKK